jgi:hypothetical protein
MHVSNSAKQIFYNPLKLKQMKHSPKTESALLVFIKLFIGFMAVSAFYVGCCSAMTGCKSKTVSPLQDYVDAVQRKYEDSVRRSQEPKRLLTEKTDENGYTTVTFTQGKDTFGLDFLTPHELDSFKKAEGFK